MSQVSLVFQGEYKPFYTTYDEIRGSLKITSKEPAMVEEIVLQLEGETTATEDSAVSSVMLFNSTKVYMILFILLFTLGSFLKWHILTSIPLYQS